jgi:hypothetical protein
MSQGGVKVDLTTKNECGAVKGISKFTNVSSNRLLMKGMEPYVCPLIHTVTTCSPVSVDSIKGNFVPTYSTRSSQTLYTSSL